MMNARPDTGASSAPGFAEDDILGLEQSALEGWPAHETHEVGGWSVRMAGGCTKRANSATALRPCSAFDDVHDRVTRIYEAHRLPTIFRITPLTPPGVDALLDNRGYRLFEPSLNLVGPTRDARTAPAVMIEDRASAAWLDGIAAVTALPLSMRRQHDAIIAAIAPPTAFAMLVADGEMLGFGFAVSQHGWIGLFDIVVAPHLRGHGHGARIVESLIAWGRSRGADNAYLQVKADNHITRRLY